MDNIANEFGEVAARYCSLIESTDKQDWDSFRLTTISLLAELIYKAHQLPDVEGTGANGRSITQAEWKEVFDNVSTNLKFTYYWTALSPTDLEDDSLGCGDLADDLADIWRDLKEGLLILENNPTASRDAIWQWRFGLSAHWGDHAAQALSCLQSAGSL